jgi:medium-chain acyl-[acyl-carrier-protein] hydrolase
MQNKWFKKLKASENCKMRLFCFPHAGGSAEAFKHWGKYLPEWIELYSTQLPGRGSRLEEPLTDKMDFIIDQLVNNIYHLLAKPFIFLGHSLGGSIAFELAKKLRKLNYGLPFHLFIVGREGPRIPPDSPKHNVSNKELIDYLRLQSGTHNDIFNNEDLLELLLPIVRCDLKLADTYFKYYKKEEPLPCPITVFWGTSEVELNEDKVGDWGEEANNNFDVVQFQGHHFFLHEQTSKIIEKLLDDISVYNYIKYQITRACNLYEEY